MRTHSLIYWLLILPMSSVNTSKVKVINMTSETTSQDLEDEGNVVVVGLLLPATCPHPGAISCLTLLDSVLPGVVVAARELQNLLPNWSWHILVGDTACNSTTGPLQAVDMVYRHRY